MPDDPKTALPEGEVGSAEKAPGTPPESTSDAETPEQKIERLQRERDAAVDRARREAELRLSHQSKVEEANRIMADGRTATDDPLEAEIADLQRAQAEYARQGVVDPATNRALRTALEEKRQREMEQENNRRIAQARSDMASVPEQYRSRTWALWAGGGYWSVADAFKAAKGEEADELRKRLEERDASDKKREAEILARQAKAPGSAHPGAGGAATTSNQMPLSDYIQKVNALRAAGDLAGAAKLTKDKDEGRISIDYAS